MIKLAPIIKSVMSTAIWLTMIPGVSFAQDFSFNDDHQTGKQAQIFLNAGNLTSIEPLLINFHPQQLAFEEENLKLLKAWVEKIEKTDTPIHVYSYASPPMSRRDMTEKSAHHMAIRKAFNRAIDAKNILENEGVPAKLIALHAIGAKSDNRPNISNDQLHITIRNN